MTKNISQGERKVRLSYIIIGFIIGALATLFFFMGDYSRGFEKGHSTGYLEGQWKQNQYWLQALGWCKYPDDDFWMAECDNYNLKPLPSNFPKTNYNIEIPKN